MVQKSHSQPPGMYKTIETNRSNRVKLPTSTGAFPQNFWTINAGSQQWWSCGRWSTPFQSGVIFHVSIPCSFPRNQSSYSQMMSKGCPITETKRIVFRFHYHSQKVIGCLGIFGRVMESQPIFQTKSSFETWFYSIRFLFFLVEDTSFQESYNTPRYRTPRQSPVRQLWKKSRLIARW